MFEVKELMYLVTFVILTPQLYGLVETYQSVTCLAPLALTAKLTIVKKKKF